jgi:RNA polymerase sigma factor (sigma-70 family)
MINPSIDSVIPHKPLTPQRKAELEATLRFSNSMLKEYSEKTNIKRVRLLSDIAKGKRTFGDVTISPDDASVILRTKEVEMEILSGHSKLISNVAKKWTGHDEAVFSAEDVYSEAMSTALMAVAHYTKEVRFTTFLVRCIQNRLSRFFGTSKGISRDGLDLKRKYEKLSSVEGSTFDSVVREMGISKKQVDVLKSSLSKTFNVTELSGDPGQDEREFNPPDLTEMPSEDVESLKKVLKSMPFSPLERVVIDAVMSSPTGQLGLSKSCGRIVNPQTNKPFTRAALSWAWNKAKKRIGEALSDAA